LTLPLVESLSLAMWCSISSSLSPPPPHPLPPLTLTCSLCFPLTLWSSHLCRGLLQVLLHRDPCRARVPARRLLVTPLALRPARIWGRRPPVLPRPLRSTRFRGRHPPVLPRPLRSTRVRGCRLPHLLRVSPSRARLPVTCAACSARPLLRRRRRHHRHSPRLPVSCRRCTTHRSFTDTHGMFTLW
jgi:hypothetical protein